MSHTQPPCLPFLANRRDCPTHRPRTHTKLPIVRAGLQKQPLSMRNSYLQPFTLFKSYYLLCRTCYSAPKICSLLPAAPAASLNEHSHERQGQPPAPSALSVGRPRARYFRPPLKGSRGKPVID